MNQLLSDSLSDLHTAAYRLECELEDARENTRLACGLAQQAVGVGRAFDRGNHRLRKILVEDLTLAHAANVHASMVVTEQGSTPSEIAIRNHQRAATTIRILESVLRSMNEVGVEISDEITALEGPA
jgi:hypothetical protein